MVPHHELLVRRCTGYRLVEPRTCVLFSNVYRESPESSHQLFLCPFLRLLQQLAALSVKNPGRNFPTYQVNPCLCQEVSSGFLNVLDWA